MDNELLKRIDAELEEAIDALRDMEGESQCLTTT